MLIEATKKVVEDQYIMKGYGKRKVFDINKIPISIYGKNQG